MKMYQLEELLDSLCDRVVGAVNSAIAAWPDQPRYSPLKKNTQKWDANLFTAELSFNEFGNLEANDPQFINMEESLKGLGVSMSESCIDPEVWDARLKRVACPTFWMEVRRIGEGFTLEGRVSIPVIFS